MPQLTIRGISVKTMTAISGPLVEELVAVCQCGTDNFTLDCLETTSVFGGQKVDTYPFIEVAWFERGAVQMLFGSSGARGGQTADEGALRIGHTAGREDMNSMNSVRCIDFYNSNKKPQAMPRRTE